MKKRILSILLCLALCLALLPAAAFAADHLPVPGFTFTDTTPSQEWQGYGYNGGGGGTLSWNLNTRTLTLSDLSESSLSGPIVFDCDATIALVGYNTLNPTFQTGSTAESAIKVTDGHTVTVTGPQGSRLSIAPKSFGDISTFSAWSGNICVGTGSDSPLVTINGQAGVSSTACVRGITAQTVTLKSGGLNCWSSINNGKFSNSTYGIYCDNLVVTGGQLVAKTAPSAKDSIGIMCTDGANISNDGITSFGSAIVDVYGYEPLYVTSSDGQSIAIYAGGDITVSGNVSLNAYGGESNGGQSTGISAGGDITVSGNVDLKATGAGALTMSAGILCGSISLNKSGEYAPTVTAAGKTYGVSGNISVAGGTLIASGGSYGAAGIDLDPNNNTFSISGDGALYASGSVAVGGYSSPNTDGKGVLASADVVPYASISSLSEYAVFDPVSKTYKVGENTAKTVFVERSAAVASVLAAGSTQAVNYPTFEAALAAATAEANGATLTLLRDADVTGELDIFSGDITIDLNSFTIGDNGVNWDEVTTLQSAPHLFISRSAKVTFTDNSPASPGMVLVPIYCNGYSEGKLVLERGTFRNLSDLGPIHVDNDASLYISGATVVEGSYSAVYFSSSGNLSIEGGRFKSKVPLSVFSGAVNITGGTFEGSNYVYINTSDNVGVSSVSLGAGANGEGADFRCPIRMRSGETYADFSALLAAGCAYKAADGSWMTDLSGTEKSDGTIQIPAAKVLTCDHSAALTNDGKCACGKTFEALLEYNGAGTYEESFSHALESANPGSKITLLAPTVVCGTDDSSMAADKSVTIDLNGKTLAPYGAGGLSVTGQVTIQDNAGGGIVNLPINVLTEQGGKLTLTGGTYKRITFTGDSSDVSDALPEGYSFKSADGSWITEEETLRASTIGNVTVAPLPIYITAQPADESCTYMVSNTDVISATVKRGSSTSPVTYSTYTDGVLMNSGSVTFNAAGEFTVKVGYLYRMSVGTHKMHFTFTDETGFTVTTREAIVTVSASDSTPTINCVIAPDSKTYDGNPAPDPRTLITILSGAQKSDITQVNWYNTTFDSAQNSYVKDGDAFTTPPTNAGTYVIEYVFGSGNFTSPVTKEFKYTISPNTSEKYTLTYSNATRNCEKTYTIDLVTYAENLGYGEVTSFTILEANTRFPAQYLTGQYRIEGTNLILPLAAASPSQSNEFGSFAIEVKCQNYSDCRLILSIQAEDKQTSFTPLSVTAEDWSYGDDPIPVTYTVPEGTKLGETITYSGRDGTDYPASTAVPTEVGLYTVTVVCEMNDMFHKGIANFAITQKDISGAVVTLSDYELAYNGSAQSVTVSSVKLGTKALVEGTDYTIADASQLSRKELGTNTVIINGIGNYTGTASASFEIVKRSVTAEAVVTGSAVYNGKGQTPAVRVTYTENGNVVELTSNDYTLAYSSNINANDDNSAKVTVSPASGGNYTFSPCDAYFSIAKGQISDPQPVQRKTTKDTTKDLTVNLVPLLPALPEDCSFGGYTFRGDNVVFTANGSYTHGAVTVANGELKIAELHTLPDAVNDGTVRVTVTSGNYEPFTITITLHPEEKLLPEGSVVLGENDVLTYGDALGKINPTGSMTYNGNEVPGTFTWDAPTAVPDAGTHEAAWTFTPAEGDVYKVVHGTVQVKVDPAASSGVPDYKFITSANKTLRDAALGLGTITVPGRVIWVDNDGFELPYTTIVSMNKSYRWVFIPDSSNYTGLEGSVVLWSFRAPTTPTKPSGTVTPGGDDLPFTDVKKDDFFYDAVKWAVDNNITTGVTSTLFGSYDSCTRGQLVTFLWRAAGCPTSTSGITFDDVHAGAYCYTAVRWAVSENIVTGYGDGKFGMNDIVTREQVAAILFRFAQYRGLVAVTLEENLSAFADRDQISGYAVSAMNWAVGQGIINGSGELLMPKSPCVRSQVVTLLERLMKIL